MRLSNFRQVCNILAAYNWRRSGHTIREIAESSGYAKSTVSRWLSQLPNRGVSRNSALK